MCDTAPQLQALLDKTATEREVHGWLKTKKQLVITTFWGASNMQVCVPEFRVGTQFRADFLLVYAYSGGYQIKLVELKAPQARLYDDEGRETRDLRDARAHIQEWKAFVADQNQMFRHCVSDAIKPAGYSDWSFTHGCKWAHDAIKLPHVPASLDYHVLIGRRGSLTPEDNRRRAIDRPLLEIVTYDRVLDQAHTHDNGLRDVAAAYRARGEPIPEHFCK